MNSTTNSTVIATGWEGVPFNLGFNISFFVVNQNIFLQNLTASSQTSIAVFAFLRNRASNNKSKQLTRVRKGWLQFIYGDREQKVFGHERQPRHEIHNHVLAYKGLVFTPPTLQAFEAEFQAVVEEEDQDKYMDKAEEDFAGKIGLEDDKSETEEYERRERKAEYIHRYTDNTFLKRKRRTVSTESLSETGYWFLDLIRIRDEQIYQLKGRDAVQYLIFQRYIIYFLLLLTFVATVIVLPINLQGTEGKPEFYLITVTIAEYAAKESQYFARTTLVNVPLFSPYLWVHVILAVVLHPIGTYIMYHFSRIIEAQERNTCTRTLFIRGIPERMRSKQLIRTSLLNAVKGIRIVGLQLVYDVRALQNMHLEYINVLNAKYYCEEYVFEFNERFEGRPYLLGKFGGILCCCSCCPKVDGLEYYSNRQRQLLKQIRKEYNRCIDKPHGSCFITLETEEMAEQVMSYIKYERKQSNFLFAICGFICRTLVLCKNCCKSPENPSNIHTWRSDYAPYPDDINWSDIPVDFRMIWLRIIVVHVWLFLIFFFLSTPAFILQSYSSISDSLGIIKQIAIFSPLLTSYFAPLLLVLAGAILPVFVQLASEMLPYDTISDKNHSIMVKTFLYLVMGTIILPSLGYNSVDTLLGVAFGGNQTFPWAKLTTSSGSLFTNYVIYAALLGNALELLRIPEIFLYFFYVNFFSSTVAEFESARRNVIFEFQFGVLYSRLLLIFFMVVTFSMTSPLIVPFGLLYVVIKYFVDRYNIYYVYRPSRISVKMHSTAITFFHLSILAMQFQVFAYLYFRESFSNRTSFLMLVLVIGITIFCINLCCNWICSSCNFRKRRRVKSQEWCACSYAPNVLYDLNTTGIVPLDAVSVKNQIEKSKQKYKGY
ncbi:hypothetical protein B4U80_10297 [Leptotrombidium deliense]|uniref:CSC1-like protein 2 n=1 Tax=Leptotrombidium deliense TaxID=299467 RepID=A0A443SF64_9ACAR|nr:hypothetical protein B4U80_10297 [Leptotrombidium deliense]